MVIDPISIPNIIATTLTQTKTHVRPEWATYHLSAQHQNKALENFPRPSSAVSLCF